MSDTNTKEARTLNESQTDFLVSMLKNFKARPDVDWATVAQETGMTIKSAKERYRLITIKLGIHNVTGGGNDAAGASSTSDVTPKKATTPSKKSATNTPKSAGVTKRAGKVGAKAAKAPKGKGKGKAKEEEEVGKEDEGNDEVMTDDAHTDGFNA
ncbi:hypothetical protein VP1G_01555 [Cytospora mali]|uniref:Myb-like DNA-binding domain-containing protein n=1 Tax=Cytospora mali TaxID=578113 RepID=A0A194UR83_CYTMA|nr:hypothetical protein VP1G_01555 [Valsa mali var. pyri (nom. inval.)]